MSTLITNILKLNKLENQQMTTQPETYDLSEQVTQCLLGFEELWERKDLEIDADIDEGVTVYTVGFKAPAISANKVTIFTWSLSETNELFRHKAGSLDILGLDPG